MSEGKSSWRYRIGQWMFFLPIASFVAAPIVVPILGLDAATAAAVIGGVLIGGEIIWFLSIPLLGKEGFMQLKNKAFGIFKLPSGPVSQGRHRLGVTMLLGAFIAELLVVLLLIFAYFYYPAGDYPAEKLLGLDFEGQAMLFVVVQAASALCAVASLFVLGADFVQRLQEAFQWPADS